MQKFLMICALVLTGNLFAMDHATDNNSDSSNGAGIQLADLSANADAQPEGLSPAVIRALAGEAAQAPNTNNDPNTNTAGMRAGLDPGLLHFDYLPHLNEVGLALADDVLRSCYNNMPEADRTAVLLEAYRGNFSYGHCARSFWDMVVGLARPMRGMALLASTVAPIVSFSLELSEHWKNIIITINGVCSVIALILSEIQAYGDAERQSWTKSIMLMEAIRTNDRHDRHDHDNHDQEDNSPAPGGAAAI